jgi:hypothetical protein
LGRTQDNRQRRSAERIANMADSLGTNTTESTTSFRDEVSATHRLENRHFWDRLWFGNDSVTQSRSVSQWALGKSFKARSSIGSNLAARRREYW